MVESTAYNKRFLSPGAPPWANMPNTIQIPQKTVTELPAKPITTAPWTAKTPGASVNPPTMMAGAPKAEVKTKGFQAGVPPAPGGIASPAVLNTPTNVGSMTRMNQAAVQKSGLPAGPPSTSGSAFGKGTFTAPPTQTPGPFSGIKKI
jgi:hypothetical protein